MMLILNENNIKTVADAESLKLDVFDSFTTPLNSIAFHTQTLKMTTVHHNY